MKLLFLFILFVLTSNGYSQTMQATIKAGKTPRTIDIYLKSSASFSQKDESMTFTLAIPSNVLPVPGMGTSGVTQNTTGAVTGITGLQPFFLINNFGATQREVFVSTESINGDPYYIYTFIFATTATANHDWIADVEQLIFSIQFNGCTSNCDPIKEMLVNLPNGGKNSNSYWYFQSNTIGDITNYQNPFYKNTESTDPVNGGSSDGSALSTISLSAPVSLPVTLKLFNARANGCDIDLVWETESEINADYYGIERSENSKDFSEVGQLDASSENKSSKSYSYSDNSASAGNLFYRLKMVSKDGTVTYSQVKAVHLSCSNKINTLIYPTLTKGIVNVKLSPGNEKSKIIVFNSKGSNVYSDQSNSLFRTIDLKRFANGIYLVQVINNYKITDIVKVVLAK